jgi:hypothetical protein
MWQLQLYKGDQYLGRIGFNFHFEGRDTILTISNIQGAGNQKKALDDFRSLYKKRFGEFLIESLRERFHIKAVFRGVKQTKNPPQYAMTFRKTAVPAFPIPEIDKDRVIEW